MRQLIYSKIVHDYLQRLKSALEDGYVLQHETHGVRSYCAIMRHRSNGNRISLIADFTSMVLTQKTNCVITHQQRYAE